MSDKRHHETRKKYMLFNREHIANRKEHVFMIINQQRKTTTVGRNSTARILCIRFVEFFHLLSMIDWQNKAVYAWIR